MPIVLARVDDRLVHGQVVVGWSQPLDVNFIILVDDAVAASDWERQLYVDAAPGVQVLVTTVAEAAADHAAEAAAPGGAFLLVRDLATALRLVEAGAAPGEFNVGGLHFAPGKTKVCEFVYLDDQDRAHARALLARGVALDVRDVPASRGQSLASLDPSVKP